MEIRKNGDSTSFSLCKLNVFKDFNILYMFFTLRLFGCREKDLSQYMENSTNFVAAADSFMLTFSSNSGIHYNKIAEFLLSFLLSWVESRGSVDATALEMFRDTAREKFGHVERVLPEDNLASKVVEGANVDVSVLQNVHTNQSDFIENSVLNSANSTMQITEDGRHKCVVAL